MNISKKLQIWESAQLISSEQKEKILNYEQKQSRPLLYPAFLFISAFCIGIGILSLIAYNWDKLPDSLKLISDFILLTVCGLLVYKTTEQKKKTITENLKILYALLLLSSIGLIGQIYHLGGDLSTALLFWSLITFPLVLSCKKVILPIIWTYIFYSTAVIKLLKIDIINQYFEQIVEISPFWVIWMNLILYLGIGQLISRFDISKKIAQAVKILFVMNIIGSVLFMEIFIPLGNSYEITTNPAVNKAFWILWLIGITAWGIALFLTSKTSRKNKEIPYYVLLGIMGLIMITLNLIMGRTNIGTEITASLLSFSIFLFVIYKGNQKRSKKLINLGSFLISVRFFIIYIQVFGNMMTTGLGLILSGIIFYLIGSNIYKLSHKIHSRLEESKHE